MVGVVVSAFHRCLASACVGAAGCVAGGLCWLGGRGGDVSEEWPAVSDVYKGRALVRVLVPAFHMFLSSDRVVAAGRAGGTCSRVGCGEDEPTARAEVGKSRIASALVRVLVSAFHMFLSSDRVVASGRAAGGTCSRVGCC